MGSIITITMVSTTASTYDIVNLPLAYNPTILQPLNVTTSYAAKTTNNVSVINPGTTGFLSVWYFKVIGTGQTEIYGIITDRSGSSYHYNGDYGENITIEVPSADLGITKKVDNPTPRYGDTIKFTLNVTNIGPNTAENVVVVDV
ncbi:MAG: hypothetical protein QFX38_07295, partial [Methanothermobacter sp.]|nr:hypothetical protein [Methanothermobacter sp.]